MENVIIIGGGPAGLSAAIYLARAGLKPLVFAGSPPGGQLTLTSEVENFPGHLSILGAELIQKMRNQAAQFGAKIIDQNISKVDLTKSSLRIYLSDSATQFLSHESFTPRQARDPLESEKIAFASSDNAIVTKSIIIATGAKALWLGLESEKRLRGKGVSACATCDGFFFRGKTVAVVGGGDTALEEALALTKFADKVYIIHRRDSFRASKIMVERVKKNPKIEILFNSQVEEIIGEKKVEGINLKSQIPNGKSKSKILNLEGIFIAIGHKPDTDLFKNQVKMDKKGYILTKDSQTSIKGVFAAGDCVDTKYRQAVVAAGMGVSAALELEKYLEKY